MLDMDRDYTYDPIKFQDFIKRLQVLTDKHPMLLENTLANIFSTRIIGNKTHGDLAEIGLTEFVNRFMYDYECIHVGKESFRKKKQEEDIAVKEILNNPSNKYIPISLKAYGFGYLQLSTDKSAQMYNYLIGLNLKDITDSQKIQTFFDNYIPQSNILPLIYKENKVTKKNPNLSGKCNILIFNTANAVNDTKRIVFIDKAQESDFKNSSVVSQKTKKQRKYPIFMFLNSKNQYICEVRYGDKAANALQRGWWSNTKNASEYFSPICNNWIVYNERKELIRLLEQALNSSISGQRKANEILKRDINRRKHF